MTATAFLVFGDGQNNAYVVDITNGLLTGTVVLPSGSLSNKPLIYNGVAYGPTSGGFVYGITLFSPPALLPNPVQLSAAINAPPIMVDSSMVVASADGYLTAFDISGSGPVSLGQGSFLPPGTTASTVGWIQLVPSAAPQCPAGRQLVVATGQGMFSATIASPGTITPNWSSATSSSFLTARPIVIGTLLLATAGKTLFAWDISETPGSAQNLAPLWQWSAMSAQTLYQPWQVAEGVIMVGDDTGNFYLIGTDGSAGQTLTGLQGISASLTTFASGVLYQTSANGTVAAFVLDFSSGAPVLRQLWSVSSGQSVAAAPMPAFAMTPSFAGVATHLPATNGTLLRYDDKGNALSSISLGSSSVSSITLAASALSTDATGSVRFLLDGSEYFTTLRNLLMCVRDGTFAPSAIPATPSAVTMINNAAGAGSEVFVIGWKASATARLLRRQLTLETLTALETLATLPNVKVYAETYGTPLSVFLSTHQKVAIFSINGVKVALVGGFNLETPTYFDTPLHPMLDPSNLHTWHDTAVLLQGDVVDLVEAEFDRHWSKPENAGQPKQPTSSSYAKIAFWSLGTGGCLDNDEVCRDGVTPTPFVSPSVTTSAVNLSVLVTDSEKRSLTQIRDALLLFISQAESYIFFENQAFADGRLVDALVTRLKISTGLKVIIMTPAPYGTGEDAIYYALTSVTLCAIYLQLSWTSLTYKISGVSYTLTNATPVGVYVNPDDIFASYFFFFSGGQSLPTRIFLWSVTNITGTDPRVIACCPARYFSNPPAGNNKLIPGYASNFRAIYIHSKLALFDDKVAVIGSANFTTRSLLYDGELSIAIHDPATAAAIRTRLFSHWSATDAATWETAMATFAATGTNGIGPLPLGVSQLTNQPLPWPEFIKALVES